MGSATAPCGYVSSAGRADHRLREGAPPNHCRQAGEYEGIHQLTAAFLALLAALWTQPSGWSAVGPGVSCRDTGRTRVYGTFLTYGGWGVKEAWARAWVDEVYRTALTRRGIRYLCAVRGPADVDYVGREIGNASLARRFLAQPRGLVIVAAHSSGSFVAHELFAELEAMGPRGVAMLGRMVYYDLDGGEAGLTPDIVDHLRRAYFVYADDSTTGTRSANAGTMLALGTRYAAAGGVLEVNAARSGCRAGAKWCLHDALVTERPHNPETFDLEKDYQGFLPDRPAAVAYLAAPWDPPARTAPDTTAP